MAVSGLESGSVTRADDDHAYTQGPVLIVSFVRTQPGMFEEYMRYLGSTYKAKAASASADRGKCAPKSAVRWFVN
jgi:hypothetical protein